MQSAVTGALEPLLPAAWGKRPKLSWRWKKPQHHGAGRLGRSRPDPISCYRHLESNCARSSWMAAQAQLIRLYLAADCNLCQLVIDSAGQG